MRKMRQRGFTLIELSIVLVIIALLIGGVMAARTLIRTSEMQSVISEAHRYTQAMGQFRDKYKALPGDFSRATALWGAADADPETCKTTAGDPPLTCDGDSDGFISAQIDGEQFESFRVWQHLHNAGMGEFFGTGVAGANNDYDRVRDENSPPSGFPGATWGVVSITVSNISSGTVDGIPYLQNDIPPNTLLWFGGRTIDQPGKRMNKQEPVLLGSEGRDIDQKVDDGLPNSGKVIAQINPAAPLCSTDTDEDGTYDTSGISAICALIFKTGY